ncbi:hypothetical protein NDU88_005765 [Pleurodeles waltl]|uniref:Uncharacterized protein n=1 Tax=Pleurodeles waltl TaxID=8319 RepID=A0AAV7LM53_PLEWA|nr:hypothetical protein NDU88_005765 [Pleurodeles waltl]
MNTPCGVEDVDPQDGEAPITHTFMETRFSALRKDLAALKQEVTADIKDLKRDLRALGQRVTTLEHVCDRGKRSLKITTPSYWN